PAAETEAEEGAQTQPSPPPPTTAPARDEPGQAPRAAGDDPPAGGALHERFAKELPSGAPAKERAQKLSTQEQRAFKAYRKLAPRLDWMVGLQQTLGVAVSGRLDRATIGALSEAFPGSDGVLDKRLARTIAAKHPELGDYAL